MSTTIDQKVVEMRFDNQHFENNVKTTMSTLDKLKHSLKLTESSKGFENISSAAKKVDMSGLSNGIETVNARFSALQVMGVTALANITNSAVNAGKRIVSALTIDPVKTGFQEYETQINAVQTILANTKSKGSTIDDVNKALDELNKYADLTIYNFTEMTRNIGTFTAAGIDLETSVNAIQGIANLAAVSGSTSQQASTAMYQLSQALASGTVKLMDWNSVVNAGMGGQVFQDALKKTSELLGTGAEAAIKAEGSFRESLTKGWLTAEVLTETLKRFTTSGANEYIAEYTGLTLESIEAELKKVESVKDETKAIDQASEALAKMSGKSKEEIKNALEFARTAENAATKVKTFSQLWDVIKEAVQSGWSQTWRLVIGDFEEAKELLTPLADFFTNIIGKMSDARNTFLEAALKSPFGDLVEKINSITDATETVIEATKNYDEVVNRIIRGDFGNGQSRWDKLTEAGYSWAKAQNLVNEKLGCSVRHAEEMEENQEKINKSQAKSIKQLMKMNDHALQRLGFTDKEIKALRELEKVAKQTGYSIEEIINDPNILSGRQLMIDAFKNIGKSIVGVFTAMKQAWKDTFSAIKPESLYNLIAGFRKFTAGLILTEESSDKLYRTFKGVFAILDLVKTLTGGPLYLAFKMIKEIMGYFNLDILDVTASLGDAISGFNEWVNSILDFEEIFKGIEPTIKNVAEAIQGWIDKLRSVDNIPKFIFETIKGWFTKLIGYIQQLPKNASDAMDNVIELFMLKWYAIPSSISAGFEKGLFYGIASIVKNIRKFCTKIIEAFCDVFVIHSPSRVMFEIGQNVLQGFVNGMISIFSSVIDVSKGFLEKLVSAFKGIDLSKALDILFNGVKIVVDKIKEVFGGINFGKLFASGLGIGILVAAFKTLKVIEMLGKPLAGIGTLLSGIGEAFSGLGKRLKAGALKQNAKALLLLSASVVLLVFAVIPLSELDLKQLAKGVTAVVALAAALTGFAFALSRIGGVDFKASANLLAIGGTIFLIGWTIKQISSVANGNVDNTIKLLQSMVLGIISIFFAVGLLLNMDRGANIDKAGTMMAKMAVALLTMSSVVKVVSGFTYSDIKKGLAFVTGVGILFAAITAISRFAGANADKAGAMLLRMSVAILIMAGVVKIITTFSEEDIKKGLIFIAGVEAIFIATVAVSWLAGKNAQSAGKMIRNMALAMLLIVACIKIVGGMKQDEIDRGFAVVSGLQKLFIALVAVSHFAGKHAAKAGVMLLAMAFALGVVAAILYIVSKMDQKELWKAFPIIAAIEALFAGLMFVSKYAQVPLSATSTLSMLLIAVGLMVTAVIALSFINPKNLAAATASLSAVMGMFALMTFATKYAQNTKDMQNTLLSLLGVTVALTAIVAALSFIPNPDAAIKTSAALSILLMSFSACIVILGNSKRVLKTALDALPIIILVAANLAVILGFMSLIKNVEPLIPSAIALGILLNAFASSIVILSKVKSDSNIDGALAAIPSMLLVVAGLAVVLGALAKMNVEASLPSAIALGILLNAFTSSIVILSMTKGISMEVIPVVKTMGIVVAELAIILGLLAAFNVEASIPSAIALGILVNALSASMVILSKAGYVSNNALLGATIIGLVLIGLAVALGIMAKMDVNSAIPSAIALSILLVTMTGVTAILGALSGLIAAAIPAVIGLGIVIAELAIVLAAIGGLVQMPGLKWLISEGGTLLQAIGTAIGQFIGGIVGGIAIGSAAALPIIGASLSLFMKSVEYFIKGARGIDSGVLEGVGYLSAAILALAVADFVTGIVTLGGLGLVDLGLKLTAFAISIIPFISTIKSIDNSAIDAANSLAELVLVLAGAEFLNGLTNLFSKFTGNNNMESFSAKLEPFGKAIVDFSNTLKEGGGVDKNAVENAADAGLAMTKLANSIPRSDGFLQDIVGEKDLERFGTMCEAFGKAIKSMSAALTGEKGKILINQDAVDAAVTAGCGMSDVANAIPKSGGFLKYAVGEKDLETFGNRCKAFGAAIKEMSASLTGENGAVLVNQDAVEAACAAGYSMSDLANALPKSDGFLQDVVGEKDLETFGSRCKAFGAAIKDMSSSLTGEKGEILINDGAITSAKKAGEMMAAVQAAIPTDKWLDGKISIDDFGKKIKTFGGYLSEYSEKVSEMDGSAVSSSITQANRLVAFAQSIADLDTSGIEKFKVKSIGSAMKAYANKVEGIDPLVVSSSISSANRLVGLINRLVGIDTSGIESFKVKSIGSAMKGYYNEVSGIDVSAVSGSISTANRLRSFITSLSGMDTSGVGTFKKAIESLATVQIGDFAAAFETASAHLTNVGQNLVVSMVNGMKLAYPMLTSVSTAMMNAAVNNMRKDQNRFRMIGIECMKQLAVSFSSQRGRVNSALSSMMNQAVSSLKSYFIKFYNAGKDLVSGFASGITINTFRAEAAAAAMARAAYSAAKEALDINSPSKIFRRLAYSVPEGFAMGIDRMSWMVEDASIGMADTAINGVSRAISRISDAINSDIDTQPTIQPVLDLTNVRNGVGAMNNMFGINPSVSALTNVSSIGSMMSGYNQNGTNGEVVSAIDKLRKDLGNYAGSTYIIDGITYDDGSNVSNAIQTLVRAAKMEGRR